MLILVNLSVTDIVNDKENKAGLNFMVERFSTLKTQTGSKNKGFGNPRALLVRFAE